MTRSRSGIRAAGATDVGRQRTVNEDRYHVDADRGVFMVVDGIGGHAAGDRAADIAIAAMCERLSRETGPVADRIREAITIANNEIHRLASTRPEWAGMACVLTVAVVGDHHAVVGHVGDSRLYRLQGRQIEKITPDHSPVGEREDARELSELEAMRHPRRNEVYRDVGSEPHLATDQDFVFLTEIDLPPDAALLICSDGLTDLIPSDRIRDIVTSRAGSPESVVAGLVAAANEAGGKDNVTAVYVEGAQFARAAGHQTPLPSAARNGGGHSWLLPFSVLLVALAGGVYWLSTQPGGLAGVAARVAGTMPATAVTVGAGDSIAEAIARAAPGSSVIVEPGEYRERIVLGDHIRVVSRVPRAATIRLPGLAAEEDAAVVAAGVVNAELNGFRIVGDAATPLGIGVLTRDAAVRLVDLDVTGAATAALDIGSGDGVMLVGSDVHDNPGAALLVRAGATPRIAHNVFARNASSERTAAAFVVESEALPEWLGNVFHGIGPEAIAGLDETTRQALPADNWFVRPATVPAVRRREAPAR